MKRKFCTALCLILALLFFNGCGFINFSFETTEPQTTETEITTKITDDFDFAVEDVPKLPPDPLGIRELKYEEMPTFDLSLIHICPLVFKNENTGPYLLRKIKT